MLKLTPTTAILEITLTRTIQPHFIDQEKGNFKIKYNCEEWVYTYDRFDAPIDSLLMRRYFADVMASRLVVKLVSFPGYISIA